MKSKLIALASAAMIASTAVALPNKAQAYWRGGWWVPGAVIGGLALGAIIASRPYYYGYGPYYYGDGPGPYYYGGGPYYYGRGSYYYGGPRYYSYRRPYYTYGYPYRHWTEF